jgi:hypothetical protein
MLNRLLTSTYVPKLLYGIRSSSMKCYASHDEMLCSFRNEPTLIKFFCESGASYVKESFLSLNARASAIMLGRFCSGDDAALIKGTWIPVQNPEFSDEYIVREMGVYFDAVEHSLNCELIAPKLRKHFKFILDLFDNVNAIEYSKYFESEEVENASLFVLNKGETLNLRLEIFQHDRRNCHLLMDQLDVFYTFKYFLE